MSRKVAETWLQAFQEKDISVVNLAEGFSHASPFGVVEGRDTYLDMVRGNEAAFFDVELEVQDIIAEGEKVAIRYLINGNEACDVVYVEGEQIAKIFSYYHFGEKPSF